VSRASVLALTIALATSVAARAEDAALPNHELAERHEALTKEADELAGKLAAWGFDGAGHAIMVVQPIGQGQSFLWLVTGLGNALVISSNNSFSGPPVADKHGLWFMNYQTTFLWVPGVGMQVQANIGGNLAGACI